MRAKFKEHFPHTDEILIMQPRPGGHIQSELRPISQFDVVLKAVCRRCNQGWLNDLENEVLPLLLRAGKDGEDLHTTPDAMQSLGFWAVVRAMLRTHISPEGRVPEHFFRAAYETRVPPRGCFAHWAYSEHYVAAAGVHQGPAAAASDADYAAHVSFGLGGMLFQVGLSGGSDWSKRLALKLLKRPQLWFPDSFYWIAPRELTPRTIHPLSREAAFAAINSAAIAAGLPILMDDGTTIEPTDVIPERFHNQLSLAEFAEATLSYG